MREGQGPTVLAVGAGGGGLDIFSLIYHFSVLSPSLWETARYRLKYCLEGPFSPKQPTNQIIASCHRPPGNCVDFNDCHLAVNEKKSCFLFSCKTEFFLVQNNVKNLDPSFKTDLGF